MRSANPTLASVYSLQNSLVSDGKPLSLSEAALSSRYIKLTPSGGYLTSDNILKLAGLRHCFLGMKILKANAGALTNFEVLDFLRSRGAAKDPTRVIVSVAPSEFKVFDYLEQSIACNQTRESVTEFAGKCKKYKLADAEILNIINIRPSSAVEIDPIIEQCEKRLGESVEELVELVAEVFPASAQTEPDEAAGEDNEEIPDGQQMDAS